MTELEWLDTILDLGWPAIVMVAIWIVWRRYVTRTDELIDVLREVAGMRTTLRMKERETALTDSDLQAVAKYRAVKKFHAGGTLPPAPPDAEGE